MIRGVSGRTAGKIAYLAFACVLPAVALADDLPKQGTTNYTDYSVLTAPRTMALGKTGSITVYEVDGVSRNDDGGELFNNMAIRCLGESLTIGGEATVRGACVQADKDGDQLFIRYEASRAEGSAREGGTEHYIGGTGKYLGFAGKADFTAQFVKAADGTIRIILPHHATWTRP